MALTRTTTVRIIKIAISLCVLLIIVIYAVSRSLNYARGPIIFVSEPSNWASIASSTTLIVGHVDRVRTIALNGHPITIDEQGNFKETIIIFSGMNTITLAAQDQFGRTTSTTLTLVGSKK